MPYALTVCGVGDVTANRTTERHKTEDNAMTWTMTDGAMDFHPWRELQDFQREFDRLALGLGRPASRYPALNVWSDRDRAVVQAELPGFDPDAIHLTVNGNLLTLEGERKETPRGGDVEFHRRELGAGPFSRTVLLPFEVEEAQSKAQYRNGVLSIALPRKEATKPQAIKVVGE